MKAEIQTFKNVIRETAIYRSNTVASFLVILVPILFLLVFWNSAFDTVESIGGYSRNQLFAYYLLVVFLQDVLLIRVNYEISGDVRSGRLSSYLLRPFGYIRHCFSVFMAVSSNALLYTGFIVIPILALMSPEFFRLTPALCIGALSLLLASLISFCFGSFFGCISFWFEDISSLQTGLGIFVPILSGAFLPMSFFPGWLKGLLEVLPFRYSLSFPVEVLSGRIDTFASLNGLIIQVFWVIVGAILLMFTWSKGKRVYTAYGS